MVGDSGSQVFDGVVDLTEGQIHVASDADAIGPDMFEFFLGQRNGLLGAAQDGVLCLMTGKADGEVGFTVYVTAQGPDLDDSWEDCVEASFSPTEPVVALFDWGEVVTDIPLGEGIYRVRYTARGMDAGEAATGIEAYGLWFWPAPAAPDAIIKQTSKSAAY